MLIFRKSYMRLAKPQRLATVFLLSFLVLAQLLIEINDHLNFQEEITPISEELKAIQNQLEEKESFNFSKNTASNTIKYKPFNPNDYGLEDWKKLGFSLKQSEVILNYKKKLGGSFSSKEEVSKCFVISEKKFKEIEKYLLLPPTTQLKKLVKSENKPLEKTIQYVKFNPNLYAVNDWIKIGFSEKQAQVILKYKKSLGGEFSSKEQIKACFVIGAEKYNEISPYLVFSKKVDQTIVDNKINKIQSFNPNNLDENGWKAIGFTEKQTITILKYKKSLGGSFKDAAVLKKCYVISETKFKEIEAYLIFDE